MRPGCGVGGHCIALDPWFLISQFPEDTQIMQMSRKVNTYKTEWTINEINNCIEKQKVEIQNNPAIGVFGLTFKANVNDLRESPALKITKELIKSNLKVLINEPNLNNIDFADLYSIEYLLENSDIIVILVGHEKYKSLNLEKHLVLDFCGLKY